MTQPLTSKEQLYRFVSRLRQNLGLTWQDYPLRLPALLEGGRVAVEVYPFRQPKLCAMALRGTKCDTIILNGSRTPQEQNFDCAHELIHLTLHRDVEQDCFQCFEGKTPAQDSFLEWQANEGAAELMLPYQMLLPLLKRSRRKLRDAGDIRALRRQLAARFFLTESILRVRLESLKYEISQYLDGVDLDRITLLSSRQLQQQGIQVESLNDLERRLGEEELVTYCRQLVPSRRVRSPLSAVPFQSQEEVLRLHDRWIQEP